MKRKTKKITAPTVTRPEEIVAMRNAGPNVRVPWEYIVGSDHTSRGTPQSN